MLQTVNTRYTTPLRAAQGSQAPARTPDEPRDAVFSFNPQDPLVMAPTTERINGVSPGPEVDKARLNGGLNANWEGNFVYGPSDHRHHSAVTFAAAAKTIEMFEQASGQPIRWAFGEQKLDVVANGGEMLNAYYSRDDHSVNFFQHYDRILGRHVHSGDSGEVVAHELGHAILDGVRPDYFDAFSPDVAAFHESFGDMIGLCFALQDDRVVDRVAIETGGDLSKRNIASALGEELGVAINDEVGANRTGGNWTRNAVNNFTWADPSTLPWIGGPDQLGAEPHDFSRLWTGAYYEILTNLVNQNKEAGMDNKAAIKQAGQEGLKLLVNLMKEAPHGEFVYREMAQAFVESDRKHNNGQHAALIESVMKKRLILPTEAPPPPPPTRPVGLVEDESEGPVRNVGLTLTGSRFGMFSGARVSIPVDAGQALLKSAEVRERTENALERYIAEGRIRYNDPNYQMKLPQDGFDPQGRPYIGAVVWENGQMRIERLKIAV
ncbi:MAG: hypothetical protein AB1758_11755 [Candidatus Eremiobacterota bacterium]